MLVDEVRFVADGIRTVVRPERWRVQQCGLCASMYHRTAWTVYGRTLELHSPAVSLNGRHFDTLAKAYEAACRGYALEFAALNGGVS